MNRAPAALLSAALLAGCAQLTTRAPEEAVEFELRGRLAARYGDESFTGNLAWRHGRESDELLITSPLGQGVARIVRTGEGVLLTTAEPREYRAPDAESLTHEVLGFRLPLAGLADWVRAQPSKSEPFDLERSPNGRVRGIEQRGWRIEYPDYDEAGRPTRLRLLYPGIELRLVISQWN